MIAKLLKRFIKRGQAGQSLVILAIGFIGLVGFVGIVTDVSVLFVRYSTMRRAVDAAAVAAAGQMRRVADDTDDDIAQGEATSVANLSLAARQFIELYGLSPTNVIVETCRAQQVPRDGAGNPIDRNGVLLTSGGANQEDVDRYKALCTDDELKLVRVTAQIEAPTMFLYLLGYPTVTLTESAISQTAVLDVVLILDVSESMLNETTYAQWQDIGQGRRYIPPVISYLGGPQWDTMLGLTQQQIDARIVPAGADPVLETPTSTYLSFPADQAEPRADCRVRAWPRSTLTGNVTQVPDWLEAEYRSFLGNATFESHFSNGRVGSDYYFTGYVPQYNYYGCCNDPNGDFVFDDLICQPFKRARDAAENFLARLDFLRGDRVAFVTFDQQAHAVDPDGSGPQPVMIETERNLPDPDNPGSLLRVGAVETLQDIIGVRAEPSTYVDSNNDGLWDSLWRDSANAATYNQLMTTPIYAIKNHPVQGACPFDNAMLAAAYNDADNNPDGSPRTMTLLAEIASTPNWFRSAHPAESPFYSYELRASCAGTNIGGGLAAGSSVLYQTGRREGAVWIMVLLSDGAAGASNPITRNGLASPPAQPFNRTADGLYYQPLSTGEAGYGAFGLCPYGNEPGTERGPAELLQFGNTNFPYCSDRAPQTRQACGDTPLQPDMIRLDEFPNCYEYYDVDDYARDWADWVGLAELSGATTGTGTGRVGEQLLPTIFTIGFGLNFDIGVGTQCLEPATGSPQAAFDAYYRCRRGLNSAGNPDTANDPIAEMRNADYLGEELLRYIADVGDNFRLDNDYWQNWSDERIPNRTPITDPVAGSWGPRGACETETGTRGVWSPLPPQQSCGNYFSADTGDQLNAVFNEIASRMFTRLSQ